MRFTCKHIPLLHERGGGRGGRGGGSIGGWQNLTPQAKAPWSSLGPEPGLQAIAT